MPMLPDFFLLLVSYLIAVSRGTALGEADGVDVFKTVFFCLIVALLFFLFVCFISSRAFIHTCSTVASPLPFFSYSSSWGVVLFITPWTPSCLFTVNDGAWLSC
jgi:hypothetical protein